LVALLFLPRDKSSLGHRVAQFGQLDLRHNEKLQGYKGYIVTIGLHNLVSFVTV
jgi:hypothetical protein